MINLKKAVLGATAATAIATTAPAAKALHTWARLDINAEKARIKLLRKRANAVKASIYSKPPGAKTSRTTTCRPGRSSNRTYGEKLKSSLHRPAAAKLNWYFSEPGCRNLSRKISSGSNT